ncbi:hypothetical protein AX16_007725 [Volvariella volvacea WC 439]|nr:hypothetical protein AX16_007725 [Volvariella volvacea WC 439]
MSIAPSTSSTQIRPSIDIYKEYPRPKNDRLQFTSTNPFVPTFVTSQLTQASDPASIYAARIQNRQIMLENPARESRTKKLLEEKKQRRKEEKKRRKKGLIGKKEAGLKGIWKLDESQARYELFLPLHQLWVGYMSELLGLSHRPPATPGPSQSSVPPRASASAMPSSSSMHPKLVKADFHGSIMTVRKSKNPSLIGLSGIVIHETENTFKVITEKNKVKVLPKENTIFAFAVPLYSTLPKEFNPNAPYAIPLPHIPTPTPELGQEQEQPPTSPRTVLKEPHIEFELYGNQFRFRSADRANRKFKHKETIEL